MYANYKVPNAVGRAISTIFHSERDSAVDLDSLTDQLLAASGRHSPSLRQQILEVLESLEQNVNNWGKAQQILLELLNGQNNTVDVAA